MGVVFYEKFGSDKKRTVLNKLFSSTAWSVSGFYIFGQLVEAFLYVHGPLPATFCIVHMIYKRAATTQVRLGFVNLGRVRKLLTDVTSRPLSNPFKYKANICDN